MITLASFSVVLHSWCSIAFRVKRKDRKLRSSLAEKVTPQILFKRAMAISTVTDLASKLGYFSTFSLTNAG
jgi:hypothetical protein